MIWYLLIQILAVLIYIAAVCIWYKLRRDKLEDFLDFSIERWKILLGGYIVLFLIVTICLYTPLKYTAKCSIHGNSMNTETKYSWIMGECLMKTRNGAWLPIKISRDQPEGDHVDLTN